MVSEEAKLTSAGTAARMTLPRVSVCLLTYNRAALLPRSFDSLLAQSHGDFELIVNDDCSTDRTEEVCRSYAQRDSRVRYFKNPTNLRFSGNQNAAIMRAQTDFVALVHQGDIYRSDMIEKWTRALVEHRTAALVFNGAERMDEHGQSNFEYRHPYPPLVPGMTLFDQMMHQTGSPIFGIVMVRRQCVLDAGPFDPRLPVLADVDMWHRLLLKHDAAYVAEPLMKLSPREPGHPTEPSNWSVKREHELIYALNSARRYPGKSTSVARLRLEIAPMLWKMRLRGTASCFWHRKWRGGFAGLAYMVRYANFAAGAHPDSVLDWAAVRERLEGSVERDRR